MHWKNRIDPFLPFGHRGDKCAYAHVLIELYVEQTIGDGIPLLPGKMTRGQGQEVYVRLRIVFPAGLGSEKDHCLHRETFPEQLRRRLNCLLISLLEPNLPEGPHVIRCLAKKPTARAAVAF